MGSLKQAWEFYRALLARDASCEDSLGVGAASGGEFGDVCIQKRGELSIQSGKSSCILSSCWIETVMGPMIAIADSVGLYLLEFVSRRGLEREIMRLRHQKQCRIVSGHTSPLLEIQQELACYFSGTLQEFHTSIHVLGTPFQKEVWEGLRHIPYGQTRSYADQAQCLGKPSACRAVANANGANQLALIIPCHRVIQKSGALGGYGGGKECKQWLIAHERKWS